MRTISGCQGGLGCLKERNHKFDLDFVVIFVCGGRIGVSKF